MGTSETNEKMPASIRQITLNSATFEGQNEQITPTFINFFYGRNGAGKSTIAKAIEADEGVEWGDGLSADKFDVLVYNQQFIDDNFSDYSEVAGVYTVCSDNKEKEEAARLKGEEKDKVEEKKTAAKQVVDGKKQYRDDLLPTLQHTLFDIVKPLRTQFSKVADGTGRKESLYKLIKDVKKPVAHKPEEIQRIYDVAYKGELKTYRLFDRVSTSSTYGRLPGYALMDKVIISSGDTPFSKFMNALGASSWVREGHIHYVPGSDGKCPFCQQKLPGNFEIEIAASFDEQYQKDLADIKSFQTAYDNETAAILRTLNGNLSGSIMPSLDLDEYRDKLSLLEKSIAINKDRIAAKVEKPTTEVSLEDTDSLLLEIGSLIDEINKKIKANNDVVDDIGNQKKLCKRMFQEYIASLAQPHIDAYEANYAKADGEVKKAEEEWRKLDKQSREISFDIAELNKSIKNTSDTVNRMNETLRETGFQGFHLRERADIPNHYEVIRENGEVAKNLSEGERNFISFLYFYHLVRGSQSRTEEKPKIVVIDDPVSSMDSSTLYIVGSLVREMIEVCYNNTDYKGDTELGDYIKQIFILTHNVYFHSEVTYKQEKNFRSTSFFKILKTNNVSSVVPCVRPDPKRPSEDENYNPIQNSYKALWTELKETKTAIPALNVIRQILEYYFMQMCGYDRKELRQRVLEGEHKDLFMEPAPDGGRPDPTKYHLADSLLRYISNPTGFGSEIHLIEDYADAQPYIDVFKLIFDAMEQGEHYKMMMEMD